MKDKNSKSNNRVEVVFHFDTTGSMRSCVAEVRKKIEDSLTKLFKEVPNLRIGLGANGDYCDEKTSYVTAWKDFSKEIYHLSQFVRDIQNTSGGDSPECYELVLKEAQELDWSHNSTKVFVLIADDVPHPTNEKQNIAYNKNKWGEGINWRAEADMLGQMGIMVYAVQCLSKGSHADNFYRELAERTGGYHFTLDQFSEVTDLLMAICYKQGSDSQFKKLEEEIVASGRMTRAMDKNFATLSHRKISERFARKPKSLNVVPPGRFQILNVETDTSIRDFVEENGLTFKTGRGFYELTKTELVQEKKEVVLRDKETGDMYSGDTARTMIGLNAGERAKIKAVYLEDFDVFVQSTSYNRKLIGGTRFLYEVDLSR